MLSNRGVRAKQRVEAAARAARSTEDRVEKMQVDIVVVDVGWRRTC